jgi:hypothetical protein
VDWARRIGLTDQEPFHKRGLRNTAERGAIFSQIWRRRVRKRDAAGIHGTLFYELAVKKQYYPTRRDEEAVNPDGTRLR